MDLDALIRRFTRQRLLVLGDLMLDEFIWGRVERISPEAPVPVVHVTRESHHLGGAANVVHNLRALGAGAAICGVVGADIAGQTLIDDLKAIGAETDGIVRDRQAITTRKTRVIAHSQQVIRYDHEQRGCSARAIARLKTFLARHASGYDAILVSDYGKGVITAATLGALPSPSAGPRVIVDPKKPNFALYRDVTLVTPNLTEAAEAAGVEIVDAAALRAAASTLRQRWQAAAVLITRGEQGMTLIEEDDRATDFAALSRQVYDVTGAGDTVAAVCALALAAGATFEQATEIANHAAGVVVGKLGTATVTPDELRASIHARRAGTKTRRVVPSRADRRSK